VCRPLIIKREGLAKGVGSIHAEVDAQHRLHSEGRASAPAFWCVRRDQGHQRRPWHDALHLRQELALARALGGQVRAQLGLLHGFDFLSVSARRAHREPICADFPLGTRSTYRAPALRLAEFLVPATNVLPDADSLKNPLRLDLIQFLDTQDLVQVPMNENERRLAH